jgi:hypothetical protein
MSILSVFMSMCLVTGQVSDSTQATPGGPATARRYAEIHQDLSSAMRAEATAATPAERAAAIRQMTEVYRELLADPRLAQSDTLKSYKAKLWSRLTRVQRDLEREVERKAKEAGQATADPEALEAVRVAASELASQVSLMNYTLGGPNYVWEQGGGAFGGGRVNDHGQELIDLIQRTIKPNTWDVVGGPGSIFYYQPLMALVVRATSEVHDNVGGLLGALRRAGQ